MLLSVMVFHQAIVTLTETWVSSPSNLPPSCVVIIELIDLLYYINIILIIHSYIICIYYLIKLSNF